MALALLACGLLPQAVQRADTAHPSWVSCVPFGLLAGVHRRDPAPARLGLSDARGRGAPPPVVAGCGSAEPTGPARHAAGRPAYTYRWYADYVGQSFGHDRGVANISHRGRAFYYGRAAVADAAEAVMADVEAISEPGDSLIVGTGDLRKTPYSEAFFTSCCRSSTRGRLHRDGPGVANCRRLGPGGRAARRRRRDPVDGLRRLGRAEHVAGPGSDEPNKVIDDEFCLHDEYGTNKGFDGVLRPIYQLYLRCDTRNPEASA